MTDIQIESDLKDILNKLDRKLDHIDNKFEKKLDNLSNDVIQLKIGQTEIKGEIKELKAEISNNKENIKEIKGSQRAQIWTLIGILITAVAGFLVAVGRFVFYNPRI